MFTLTCKFQRRSILSLDWHAFISTVFADVYAQVFGVVHSLVLHRNEMAFDVYRSGIFEDTGFYYDSGTSLSNKYTRWNESESRGRAKNKIEYRFLKWLGALQRQRPSNGHCNIRFLKGLWYSPHEELLVILIWGCMPNEEKERKKIESIYLWGPPGGGGWGRVPVPLFPSKKWPCSPKIFYVPYSPKIACVPLIFRPLFPWKNCPCSPKSLGGPHLFILQHPLTKILCSCAHKKKKSVIEES